MTEKLVLRAVGELLAENSDIRAVILFSGCQMHILDMDTEGLCQKIELNYGISASFCIESRLCMLDAGTRSENSQFLSLAHLLKKTKTDSSATILTDAPFTGNGHELCAALADLGVSRIHMPAKWKTFSDFKAAGCARLLISLGSSTDSAADYISENSGAVVLKFPVSYRLCDADRYYKRLSEFFGKDVGERQQKWRQEAIDQIDHARRKFGDLPLSLNLSHTKKPWNIIMALTEYGFTLSEVVLSQFPVQRTINDEFEPCRQWVAQNCANLAIKTVPPMPFSMAPEPESYYTQEQYAAAFAAPAAEEKSWAYSAITALMKNLCCAGDGE